MSDETVLPPAQTEGTVQGNTPAPAIPGAEVAGDKGVKADYLTRAEAEQLKQDVLNQARSYSDKGRVRVEKAVADVTNAVATMRNLGQAVTPEQEKALKDEAARKAMTEPEPAPVGVLPSQAAPQQPQIDPEILAIQAEKGINLLDSDPEVALIDRTKGIRKFYQSLETALETKKQRLASATQQTTTNPAARLPVPGTAPTGLPDDMPANERWRRVTYKP